MHLDTGLEHCCQCLDLIGELRGIETTVLGDRGAKRSLKRFESTGDFEERGEHIRSVDPEVAKTGKACTGTR